MTAIILYYFSELGLLGANTEYVKSSTALLWNNYLVAFHIPNHRYSSQH